MSGSILIVDPSPSQRLVLKSRLAAACYEVSVLADPGAVLVAARADRPDLLILGAERGAGDVPGLLRAMRADPALASLPVVVLCQGEDAALRRAALAAGADEVLSRPTDEVLLLARLRSLMRRGGLYDDLTALPRASEGLELAEAPAEFVPARSLALVSARTEATLRLKRDLAPLLRDRIAVMTRAEALAVPAPGPGAPDLYLIDADLGAPGGGLRLLSELQAAAGTRHAALCLLRTAPAPAAEDAMAFDLGAGDVIAAGTDPQEIALRLRALLRRKQAADALRERLRSGLRLAVTDSLTGLHNRRYGEARLATLIDTARASGSPLAVMVLDLDRFKSVNDRHGHAAGDAVLVEVARRLTASLRAGDLLARIGGEEFLIALPGAGVGEAQEVAERLCQAMQAQPVPLPSGTLLPITVSIGLALGAEQAGEPVGHVIDRADQALLRSKSSGRNQVTVSRRVA